MRPILAAAFALTAAGGLLLLAATSVVYAQDAPVAAPPGLRAFSLGKSFMFLFLTLGPLKVVGPFAMMTRGRDDAFKRRLALEGMFIAAVGVIVAATIGSNILRSWGVSIDALTITAGIVLFLIALRPVLEQYAPPDAPAAPTAGPPPSTSSLAYSPLAFPTIIAPYGIAVLIILVTLAGDDTSHVLRIMGLVALVLVLDYLAMRSAERIVTTPFVKPLLGILGAVMSVLQVALGVQAIVGALQRMGALR
jgi:multiple antibiotic resistance protein